MQRELKNGITVIVDIKPNDISKLTRALTDRDAITKTVDAVATAILNSFDFSKNAMLHGVFKTASQSPDRISNAIMTNERVMTTLKEKFTKYQERLDFLSNLDVSKEYDKVSDVLDMWESVDIGSDNYADYLLAQIHSQLGIGLIDEVCQFTFFDLYDLTGNM